MANAGDTATPAPTKAPVPAIATPAKPAPKATSSKAKAAAEEISPSAKMRRRIVWSCVWGFLAANLLMFLRFFFPRALFEPSTVFKIGYPSDFQPGVDERFKAQDRIWVVREADRIFVIFGRCTHLGCTPDWKPAEHKFKCPCHGSGYTPEGINFEGPAPRPMDRAHVELDATGQIIVDTSRLYSWPKGGVDQFNDPGSFVNV
ncbi:MAG: Rieske 2Fe-2S domain-containing protein [Terriglobia bacterium]|jgi:cytochrome b6-f complex iron-sulfur subunit